MTARQYLVKVTRVPLDKERRKVLRACGRLPADWRDRSATATDFVYVGAVSDAEAAVLALAETSLFVSGGEILLAEEALPSGATRSLPRPPSLLDALGIVGPSSMFPQEWITWGGVPVCRVADIPTADIEPCILAAAMEHARVEGWEPGSRVAALARWAQSLIDAKTPPASA